MPRDRYFVPGSWYRISDFSSFKTRSYDTKKMWNGYWVRSDREFEQRNSQDLVQGVSDEQAAPEPRPRPPNLYLGPVVTTLNANVNAGATSATVASSTGMLVGDSVEIILANDDGARVVLTAVPNSATIVFAGSPLPYAAASGAVVTDITQVAEPSPGSFPPSNGS